MIPIVFEDNCNSIDIHVLHRLVRGLNIRFTRTVQTFKQTLGPALYLQNAW